MAKIHLFKTPYATSEKQQLVNNFNIARSNLLLLVVFSAINLFMLATNSGTYFLFSASVPYLLTDLGMFFCGMYPDELYEGLEGMFFFNKSFFVVMLVISILILAVYLLCWLFSKKNKVGWLITALVMFGIDTLVMFDYYGLSFDMIIDVVFHIWVIVLLVKGIKAHYQLAKLPEDVIEAEFTEVATEGEDTGSTEIEAPAEENNETDDEIISEEIKEEDNTDN